MQLHAFIVDRLTAKIILRIIDGIEFGQNSPENILYDKNCQELKPMNVLMIASKLAVMKTCRT